MPDGLSYALISDSTAADTAIVYVHGFFGDAESTWEQLQYYVDRLPDQPFSNSDLFFYDYSAEDNFVQVSVGRLRGFLAEVFPSPWPELFQVSFNDLDWRLPSDNGNVVLREHHPYSHLVLVGHSLGGVVIRRLVADEALNERARHGGSVGEPVSTLAADVVLMAPAHLGFQPAGGLAMLQLLPFARLITRAAFLFRAFSNLQPHCQVLDQLERETVSMARVFPNARALRPRLLWGDAEGVVAVGRYDSDSPLSMEYVAGKDHVTICKLDLQYRMPAEIVLRKGAASGT